MNRYTTSLLFLWCIFTYLLIRIHHYFVNGIISLITEYKETNKLQNRYTLLPIVIVTVPVHQMCSVANQVWEYLMCRVYSLVWVCKPKFLTTVCVHVSFWSFTCGKCAGIHVCKFTLSGTICLAICDWIWEKPPSMHSYKYL